MLFPKISTTALALAATFALAPPLAHGQTPRSYSRIDGTRIPPDGTTGAFDSEFLISEIVIDDDYEICDINLRVNITHENAHDLDVVLYQFVNGVIAEIAIVVNLACDDGTENIVETFDDRADTNLTDSECDDGGDPVRPEDPLSSFIGNNVAGTWQLEVHDNFQMWTGRLNDWELIITPCLSHPTPAPTCGGSCYVKIDGQMIPNENTTGGPDSAPVISRLMVDSDEVICDLDLRVDLDHPVPVVLDVILRLVTSGGNVSALIAHRDCAQRDNIVEIFDDQANATLGGFPFGYPECQRDYGRPVRPREPLSIFNGHNAGGTWELEVRDTISGWGQGRLNEWELLVTACAAVPSVSPTNHPTPRPTHAPTPRPTPRPTDPPTHPVSCGGHRAPSCGDCPEGNGASWCNGECVWQDGSCVHSNGESVSCGGHRANNCGECPSGNGAGWCNGECVWVSGSCVASNGGGSVSCGGHRAPNCALCPHGNGWYWCNGDCEWQNGSCGARTNQ